VIVDADTSSSLIDQRKQYVNITRARKDIMIFTDDKEQMKKLSKIFSQNTCTYGNVVRQDIVEEALQKKGLKKSLREAYQSSYEEKEKKMIDELSKTDPRFARAIEAARGASRRKDRYLSYQEGKDKGPYTPKEEVKITEADTKDKEVEHLKYRKQKQPRSAGLELDL
jgi:5S rRNA maturation endonuclease (ribonuclease M5)